jgi:hypothetical protein
MSDPNHQPVSLAAGSYDYDALKKGLDTAAKGKPDAYQENVDKTLADASSNVHTHNDARTIPGYEFVDVENKDLGVTENVQVFSEKLAEEQGEAAGAIPEADAPTPARKRGTASTEE